MFVCNNYHRDHLRSDPRTGNNLRMMHLIESNSKCILNVILVTYISGELLITSYTILWYKRKREKKEYHRFLFYTQRRCVEDIKNIID